MDLLERTIWFIESHFAGELTLDEIAAVGGVSRFHLSRAFGTGTGRSVMGYARGRRLTEAAKELAGGAPDILGVALSSGYGSHEAFTRAFRDQFGLTPDQVRARGTAETLDLVEPIRMDQTRFVKLDPPRFAERSAFLVAGIAARYTFETMKGIPAQWQRFQPFIGNLPEQVGRVAYGIVSDMAEGSNEVGYMCAVEVSDADRLPKELTAMRIPAHHYAVFRHHDHIASISNTVTAIFNQWLPQSGHSVVDEPLDFFERYGEEFDPRTGLGGAEVWLPVAR